MRTIPPHDMYPVLARWRDTAFVLGRDGALSAFVEMSGRDPDGLGEEEHTTTLAIASNALAALPPNARVSTYYWHAHGSAPAPRERGHAVIDRLEQGRAAHLATKRLYRSRLLTVITLPTEARGASLDFLGIITALMLAPWDDSARRRVRRALSTDAAHRYAVEVLDAAAAALTSTLESFMARWSIVGESHLLDINGAWGWTRALATLDPAAFDQRPPVPEDHWYASLLHGDLYVCQVDGTEFLKLTTPLRYARAASVVRFAGAVPKGLWVAHRPSPLTVDGDYIIATNLRQLTPIQKEIAFSSAQNELERARFNPIRALMGSTPDSDDPRRRQIRELEGELSSARNLNEPWARMHIAALAFADTPAAARRTETALDTALSHAGVTPVWESPGLINVYRAMQPCALPFPPRELMLNRTQVAAAGLHYAHSQGVLSVSDLGGEEPTIFLETVDGQPFGFSPFVGERATLIGCGATRSGKTFMKNVLAAHAAKYRGQTTLLDYDHGSEALVRLFGDDAALVRHDCGLNPFHAVGSNLSVFKAHLTQLVASIIRSNDDPALREFAPGDQQQIDAAVDRVLSLPHDLQNLSNFAQHLLPALRAKLTRWLRDTNGRYQHYLDAEHDAIGLLTKPITAINLAAVKDDPTARGPILVELNRRIIAAFEDPARLRIVKRAVFDEAHRALRDPITAKLGVYLARTAAKFKGSVEFWTHLPNEFRETPDWEALRGAASTFMFTATPDANVDDYTSVFNITPADVQQIRSLTPKREIYLIQPERNLRKRLILDVDDHTKRWASSTADVVAQQLEERGDIASPVRRTA